MIKTKADYILLNEARKVRTKIEMKKREIIKLEADEKEISSRVND